MHGRKTGPPRNQSRVVHPNDYDLCRVWCDSIRIDFIHVSQRNDYQEGQGQERHESSSKDKSWSFVQMMISGITDLVDLTEIRHVEAQNVMDGR